MARVELNRYDRATVGLWARGYAELLGWHAGNWLAEAACHAVLARLRDSRDPSALLQHYERDPSDDFALIGSVVGVPAELTSEALWTLRDAAYYLRWGELTRNRF
ncbi:MAG TPA: hypothetical protein VNL16_14275 [Chloroflexota bacterium]|nr:hypothetical protein [Chloroflexota bacterium]